MDFIKAIWSCVSPFLGLCAVIIVTFAVLFVAKKIFRKKNSAPHLFQITVFLVSLTGIVLAVLFLPVGNYFKTQVLGLLGVLLSAIIALSSASIIGNVIAGVMLRVSKTYKPGDFIEVENTRGRVFNLGLFSTEVQIITRDTVSFPNLYLIQHPIRVTRSEGCFISAAVSLGYNIPRVTIEKLLLEAAVKTGLEEPFVYIERLLDHAVVYRVYGLLKETPGMLLMKSNFMKMVLDVLQEEGIEIVSPSYVNRREFDKDDTIIPPVIRPEPADVTADNRAGHIAFDRAEEAGSIEKQKEKYNSLLKEKEELEQKVNKEEDKEIKKMIKDKTEKIEKKSKIVMRDIETREKGKKDKK